MRVLGIDSSTSKTGWAVAQDGVPQEIGILKPPTSCKKQPEKIDWTADQIRAIAMYSGIDLAVVEECGPQRNAITFRALVRSEATVARECRRLSIPTLLVMVKAVREVTFGDGKTGKETVYEKLSALYPQLDWKPFDKGGNDQSDALAMALAGPKLRDRV